MDYFVGSTASTTSRYLTPGAAYRIFVHDPPAGAIPTRYRPHFRRCPCCGCDVLDNPVGRTGCCTLCHPHNDCQDCP